MFFCLKNKERISYILLFFCQKVNKVDVEVINNIIKEKPNLSTALGMEFLSTPEDDTCMARSDTVTAYARLLHKGSALHVWNVDIKDTSGDLISNVRVTNYIINLQRK